MTTWRLTIPLDPCLNQLTGPYAIIGPPIVDIKNVNIITFTQKTLCLSVYGNDIIRWSPVFSDCQLLSLLNGQFIDRDYVFIDQVRLPAVKHLKLSDQARRSLETKNAGGSSAISEALSIEYFVTIFHASNVLLEMEIDYWIDYKMVDFICTIGHQRVGVSVTRALGYPTVDDFDYDDAVQLLEKKITGLIIARNSVSKHHRFFKSVLHIWCQSAHIVQLIDQAYSAFQIHDFGLELKGTLIVNLTICSHNMIYQNNYTV